MRFDALSTRIRSARAALPSSRRAAPVPRRRPALEALEGRLVPTSTLFVDFGDGFSGGVLNTTVGAIESTKDGQNPNIDGPVLSDPNGANSAGNTAVKITAFNTVYGANAAATRATIMSLVRRFYAPLDIKVEEKAATSLTDVSRTLGANEAETKNNDAYVIVGMFNIGANGDNPS